MLERVESHRFGAGLAVWLVVAVALTSIATGVVAIVTEPALNGVGIVGDLQAAAEFSGTVVGFTLLVTAWWMRRGYRLAYLVAAVLVFLSAAHGVAQFRPLSIPLVVLSLGGFVVLVLTSRRFTRSASLSATQLGSLMAIVGVLCYGTAGAYALREGFSGLETLVDALYFTLVTASTVGYGDVHATTEEARLFAISLVVLGPATIAVTVGSLFTPLLQAHLSKTGNRVAPGQRSSRSEHVVVLGGSDLVEPVVEGLEERTSFVVVTDDETTAERLDDRGADVFVGDPTDDETLRSVGLEDAAAVVIAADGAVTPYATLAVRDVAPSTHLVAIAADGAGDHLERLGVDVAIDPQSLLGTAAVDAALGGTENER
ncbi:NAD-binding protein [Natrononativus amylolyticus]|uniref:NAD-binding protein n=1 Tax=Natrononativus amylolyticus TaxID=2963434 RepID=UPI0020CE9300|nr:NAD-binding protein [Natrononativus amylolyticus]